MNPLYTDILHQTIEAWTLAGRLTRWRVPPPEQRPTTMSSKTIKTQHGNVIEVGDEHYHPISIRFEDENGKSHFIALGCEDATKIARALDAFVVIHS